MSNKSSSSMGGLIKGNVLSTRTSVPQVTMNHARYSRHLSGTHTRIYSNGRSRIVIHATIRSPQNKHHSKENESMDPDKNLHSISAISTARYRQDTARNSDINLNSLEQARNRRYSLSVNKDSRQNRVLSRSISNPQEPNQYLSKANEHNYDKTLQRQHFPSSGNRNSMSNNSSRFGTNDKTIKKKDWFSNANDFHRYAKENKNKKFLGRLPCPCSCPCIVASLLTALLLGAAIAAALIVTLIKPNTTTIQSTTATSTTQLTTLTITTTTESTTVTTTTESTTVSTIGK